MRATVITTLSDHGVEDHIIIGTSSHGYVQSLASDNRRSEVQQTVDDLLATAEQLQQLETTNFPVNIRNTAAVSARQPMNFANATPHGCPFQFTMKV